LHTVVSPNHLPYHGSLFGYSVSGVDDVTGDGYGDFIVGAPYEVGRRVNTGRVYVFDGSSGTLVLTLLPPKPPVGDHKGLGTRVSGIPDMTGDGLGDIPASATDLDRYVVRIFCYSRSNGRIIATFSSISRGSGDLFRYAEVAGIPDINLDGYGDLLIGGTEVPGQVDLYDGLSRSLVQTFDSPTLDVNASFGWSVAPIPTENWDATTRIVVGARDYWSSVGRAYIIEWPIQPSSVDGWSLFK
jgi:FG-GAP repeat protein